MPFIVINLLLDMGNLPDYFSEKVKYCPKDERAAADNGHDGAPG